MNFLTNPIVKAVLLVAGGFTVGIFTGRYTKKDKKDDGQVDSLAS